MPTKSNGPDYIRERIKVPKKLPKLTPEIIGQLKRQGLNQSDIARLYGISRQAVAKIKSYHSTEYQKSPREAAMEHFPWVVAAIYAPHPLHRRMRDHFEYMATGGKGMAQYKLEKLERFYRSLRDRDAVVEFDPNIPPERGRKYGGFALRPRLPCDGLLIIRVNEHTRRLSEESKIYLRMPKELPEV